MAKKITFETVVKITKTFEVEGEINLKSDEEIGASICDGIMGDPKFDSPESVEIVSHKRIVSDDTNE